MTTRRAIPSVEATLLDGTTIIEANSIASAEAFGEPSLVFRIAGSRRVIPTIEATLYVSSTQQIDGTGISSGEAFGSPEIHQQIDGTGIPSGEAFGSHTLLSAISPSSIASAEAFGTATIDSVVTATINAVGTLLASASVTYNASGVVNGVGTTSAFASATRNASGVINGVGTISASASVTIFASGLIQANGTLIAHGGVIKSSSATISAVGTLIASGATFYLPTGQIELGGEADVSVNYYLDLTCNWNINPNVYNEFNSLWNIGEGDLRWYRVIGKCVPSAVDSCLSGVNTGGEGCSVKSMTIVAARGLSDLCGKLKGNFLNPPMVIPIESIHSYSRPLLKSDQTDVGACNTLIEEDFCGVPECLEFCVSENVTVKAGVEVSVSFVYNYSMSGGIELGGSVNALSPYYSYLPSGGITLGGSIEGVSSDLGLFYDLGLFEIEVGVETSLFDIEVEFIDILENEEALTIDNAVAVTSCGCVTSPLVLSLSHELSRSRDFNSFLKRNGLSMPSIVDLRYKVDMQCWNANFHFRGLSPVNSSSSVSWDVYFEWSCADSVGGEELGADVWKFCMHLHRKDLNSGEDSVTRIIITIPAGIACIDNTIRGVILVDTDNESATMEDGFVESVVYHDGIGIFKDKNFVNDPIFKLGITESTLPPAVNRFDVTPLFPAADEYLPIR